MNKNLKIFLEKSDGEYSLEPINIINEKITWILSKVNNLSNIHTGLLEFQADNLEEACKIAIEQYFERWEEDGTDDV